MKINMDEEKIAYQLKKSEQSSTSGFQWVLIIALGVFLGNAASFGLERAVLYWELRQVAFAATAAMEQTSRNMAASRKAQEIRSAQQKIQQQQKQAGYRQAKETCDFWTQQLTTENNSRNRINRDQACNLVNQFR